MTRNKTVEMKMNDTSALWAIAYKDMRAVGANIQVWLPMLLLPVIFGAFIPVLFIWLLRTQGVEAIGIDGVLGELGNVSKGVFGLETNEQQVAYFVMNYMFAPLFLLIPLMTSSVISADSFAGEKERGTLESLLFSPVTLQTLLIGKTLAAVIPAICLTLVTLLLSTIAANTVGWPLFHRMFFPNINWIPLILLVIPAVSFLAVLVNVLISAKVATFQAAYQLGGMVVLPILALVLGQMSGVLLLDFRVIFIIGTALCIIDVMLFVFVRRGLDRAQMFESQIK